MRSVRVYRATRVVDMYLFVDEHDDLDRVPEALQRRTGRLVEAMTLDLDAETRLARAEARAVLDAIDSQGFYLQMPPPVE